MIILISVNVAAADKGKPSDEFTLNARVIVGFPALANSSSCLLYLRNGNLKSIANPIKRFRAVSPLTLETTLT